MILLIKYVYRDIEFNAIKELPNELFKLTNLKLL